MIVSYPVDSSIQVLLIQQNLAAMIGLRSLKEALLTKNEQIKLSKIRNAQDKQEDVQ